MKEKWRKVKGSDRYEVSNMGNVRSLPCIVTYTNRHGVTRNRRVEGRILKPTRDGDYQVVSLYGDNSRKVGVHILVATAFLGKRPDARSLVMHLDDNGFNNEVGNLRWGSYKDNAEDRNSKSRQARGSSQGSAALTEAAVRKIIRKLRKGAKGVDLASEYRVSPTTISYIRQGKSWTHITGLESTRKK